MCHGELIFGHVITVDAVETPRLMDSPLFLQKLPSESIIRRYRTRGGSWTRGQCLNQELIRALQIRDDSSSHKVTVQFEKFDEENVNFVSFIERFETYLDVQNVAIANRAKVFVSSLGAKLYQLLKNLLAPDIPSNQTLDKLKDALKKHLTPKPLIIPSRHKFLNRKQNEAEGISTYIAELRALAMNCYYDKDMLNIMLHDVFVSGLWDKMILDRLFEEDNINIEKTLNIELAMKKAFKGANDVMGRGINSMQTFKKHMDKKSNFTKNRKKTLFTMHSYQPCEREL
ncbi:transposon Tf2-9 polyprotein [Trichonephila clavata]|uniref:Transposon Tf2-9 polyprotein n=1 Tax=Trichonephila clavata TaxID=2740835 RepID=A0A8X6H7Y2_TRICU|nr:transposon Tf2-9 polyprotein [Trichonephila clavata]